LDCGSRYKQNGEIDRITLTDVGVGHCDASVRLQADWRAHILTPFMRFGTKEIKMADTRPTKMAHVVYRTRRFDEMLQWYQTVFGARIQYQNPALAFATFDDEHHRFAFANLSLMQPNGSSEDRPPTVGVDHVGYTFASLSDLFETYARLKQDGIRPYWCVHHGITVSVYYADPDGNQMEFQVDCCRSNEEAHAFMNGPQFGENPVGVEYDPDEWLARVRAGQTVADLLPSSGDPSPSPIRGTLGSILQKA